MDPRPVGVFDSGLGGLTVVRELRRQLPREAIVYFGDLARLPYGTKSETQIRRFSLENTEFLIQNGIKALVIACNSSSSAAFNTLKRRYSLPIVGVIEPAVEEALAKSRTKKIGVIGTPATIESRVYEEALRKRDPSVRVFVQSCPLLVPLVEEGWLEGGVTERVIEKYLEPIRVEKPDTLILGCTHYPLLAEKIQAFFGPDVRLIDSAGPTVRKLASLLKGKGLLYEGKGNHRLKVFVSDLPRNFLRVGADFLGEKLPPVRVIR